MSDVVPYYCRHFAEYEPVELPEQPRIVGVDAYQQTHACAQEEVDEQNDGYDLHVGQPIKR